MIGFILGVILFPPLTISAQEQGGYSVDPDHQKQSQLPKLSSAQDREQGTSASRITLKVKDSTLKYVIYNIAKQADLRLINDDNDTISKKRISVNLVNVPVAQAFIHVLKGTGLEAKIASDGETVVIRASSKKDPHIEIPQNAGTITGSITDSMTGAGIEGVTVSVVGTKLSVVTQKDGTFRISQVPSGEQQIMTKLFGYRSVNRAVVVPDNGPVNVKIKLAPMATTLSGVVTTATGVQRRMEVGNDITRINVDSIMSIAPVSSLTDILETRVPGLVVMHSSGSPGARSYLRLRGTSSPTLNNEPILIVDGIRVNDAKSESGLIGTAFGPSPFDQIDPNSIETIEVFKGPSAAAMYGSDAADGVIVVTTKKGKAGRTRWTLSLEEGYAKLPVKQWPVRYFRFGRIPYAPLGSALCLNSDTGQFCMTDSVVPFQALNLPAFNPFGVGDNTGTSLTVSGGSGALTYSVTGSGTRERGISRIPKIAITTFERDNGSPAPEWLKRPHQNTTFGVNSTFGVQVGREGTVSITSSLFKSTRNGRGNNAGVDFQSSYMDSLDASSLITTLHSMYHRITEERLRFRNSLQLNTSVRTWLPVRAILGVDAEMSNKLDILPRGFIAYGLMLNGSVDSIGEYTEIQGQSIVPSLQMSTSVRMPGKWQIPEVLTSLGLNWNGVKRHDIQVETSGLERGVDRPSQIHDGTSTQSFRESSTFGWFMEPRLNLKSRFFVSPGFRFDGGSASGSRVGLLQFPKMDFSWIAIDRQGQDPLWNVLTLFRPRVAFGVAGVQPTPGDQLRRFQTGTRVLEDGSGRSIDLAILTGFGNNELRPERSREVEMGFDADFFESRFTISANWYNKLRYDAIISVPMAPSLGSRGFSGNVQGIKRNVGDVRNAGFELTVGTTVLDSRVVQWRVDATGSTNRNRLLRLAPGVPVLTVGSSNRLVPGYPLNGVWIRQVEGYADGNGDGKITQDEVRLKDSVTYAGVAQPKSEISISSSLSFWGGRLSISSALNMQQDITKEGNGNIQRDDPSLSLGQQASLAAGRAGTVSMLRWQSLSVNVEAPKSIPKLFRVSSIGVALQGRNLGLVSNYRGVDPSVGAFANGDRSGDGSVPLPRQWQCRIVVRN